MTKDGPQHHMALAAHIVATPGLQNLTGEYNCFLNVIVQCLWHCMAFRSGMLHRLDPEQLQVACLAVYFTTSLIAPVPTYTEAPCACMNLSGHFVVPWVVHYVPMAPRLSQVTCTFCNLSARAASAWHFQDCPSTGFSRRRSMVTGFEGTYYC